MLSQRSREEKKPVFAMWAMGFVWEVFMSIALPTTLFALGGRWLDERLRVSPLFVLLGLATALGITYMLMRRKSRELTNKLREQRESACAPEDLSLRKPPRP